jgi:hypothetical protein
MSVVVLVVAMAFEFSHIATLIRMGNVVDDGIRLSHGNPGEEKMPVAIHSGVVGAIGKIDAASKVAYVSAGIGSLLSSGVKMVMLSKRGKA